MNIDTTKMSQSRTCGYLEIILGSMYSGKTSRLVEIYKQCKFCNISVAVINHCIDKRYDDELLSTHDKIKIPCIQTERLFDIWTDHIDMEDNVALIPRIKDKFKVATSHVILINEGQFFPDLEEFVKCMLSENKQVYICGLDGDFERKKFGQMLDLIPLCDKVYKLTSLCSLCKNGNKGIFSMRLTSEKEQTVVGSDNYIPVCRACYEKRKTE
jgi:thymidine kinase